jgi:hypothetical protein
MPIEPRQPLFIKSDGTRADGDSANKPPMHHVKHDERCDRDEKQQVGGSEVAYPEQDPDQTERGHCKL